TLLAFAMAGPVMAHEPMGEAAASADTSYFDSHPEEAKRLRNDPSLIDNPQFMNAHPDLREYLHSHPNVRHDFKKHPYRFMHRSEVYNKHHN
ncbi:MAG TPA: hypothetical protein VGR40_11395, partial [Candidatus Binatus sp.]|nr:hypothetical protein [Candidatus Binatus sp.]